MSVNVLCIICHNIFEAATEEELTCSDKCKTKQAKRAQELSKPIPKKACRNCGQQFQPRDSRHVQCCKKKKEKPKLICVECDKTITSPVRKKTCSDKCAELRRTRRRGSGNNKPQDYREPDKVRTEEHGYEYFYSLMAPKRGRKMRKCLKCRIQFISENQQCTCGACRAANQRKSSSSSF